MSQNNVEAPVRVVRKRGGPLLTLALAVAFVGVGLWWLNTASPPVRQQPDETTHAEDDPVVDVVPLLPLPDPPDNTQLSRDHVAFELIRAQVSQLLLEGQLEQAVNHAQSWLYGLASAQILQRAQGEYLLGRALVASNRLDEAEVHLLLASDYSETTETDTSELRELVDNEFRLIAKRRQGGSGEQAGRVDKKGVTTITISLSRDFRPFAQGMQVDATPSWTARNHRLEEIPIFALEQPPYSGVRQLYGAIKLGTVKRDLYSFVFDIPETGNPVLWFDRNANYDLTDDGPPHDNDGQGLFAAAIEFPGDDIVPIVGGAKTFRIWFFTNDTLWAEGYAAHYCTTVLKGRIHLAGRDFDAYVADSGANEADFSNDGILIDLDGDGRITRPERIPSGVELKFAGGSYRFEVEW